MYFFLSTDRAAGLNGRERTIPIAGKWVEIKTGHAGEEGRDRVERFNRRI